LLGAFVFQVVSFVCLSALLHALTANSNIVFQSEKWVPSEVNHSRLKGQDIFPVREMGICFVASQSFAFPGGIKIA
jgi:hypothetical protein